MAPAVCALRQVTLFVRGREGAGLRPGGSGAGRGVSGVPHKHKPVPTGLRGKPCVDPGSWGGLAPPVPCCPGPPSPPPSPSPATLSPSPARRWEDPEAGGLRGGRQGWGALLAALWDGALPCRLCAKGVEAVGLGLGGGFWFQGWSLDRTPHWPQPLPLPEGGMASATLQAARCRACEGTVSMRSRCSPGSAGVAGAGRRLVASPCPPQRVVYLGEGWRRHVAASCPPRPWRLAPPD